MGEGLFPSAARFNHACAPNVGLSFDSWGCLVASAARDASKGEELFISYVGVVAAAATGGGDAAAAALSSAGPVGGVAGHGRQESRAQQPTNKRHLRGGGGSGAGGSSRALVGDPATAAASPQVLGGGPSTLELAAARSGLRGRAERPAAAPAALAAAADAVQRVHSGSASGGNVVKAVRRERQLTPLGCSGMRRAERRERLLRTYLFECSCDLCARGG